MELKLKKAFIKELAKLPPKIQRSVQDVLDTLEESASLLEIDTLDIRAMEGQRADENYYRIRIGSWRLGIEWIQPAIVVITILSRGDIYKKFPPK